MAIRQMLRRSLSSERRSAEVPKGHVAVYVGENEKKRFVVPVSYLNHSSFQDCCFKLRKNSGSIIRWEASPFLAGRTYSLTSSLA